MRFFRTLVLPFALVLAAQAVLAQTTAPGPTPGAFRVGESGAANYAIPVQAPPGIAGMEPKLAFNYSSQAGGGLMGLGWSVSGLSAVTRCPRTKAQDGTRGKVSYDANDRFCMDGQRLIMVSSGSYGAVGAEYRTERESFAKIVSVGGSAGQPDRFEVRTKSGQILEFGNTTDSRVEAQGSTTVIRMWALNKASDTKGNYFTVSYDEINASGEYQHMPLKVEYGGSPAKWVNFVYETRPDIAAVYEAGSRIKLTKRLTNIQTKIGTTLVTDYRIAYDAGGNVGASRVTGIQMCDASNACLSNTAFTAGTSAGDNSYLSWVNIEGWGTYVWYKPILADFNGDGKTDIFMDYRDGLGRPNGYRELWISNGNGTFTKYTVGTNGTYVWYWPEVGDFNGDGKADLLMDYRDGNGNPGGTREVWLSNGNGTFQTYSNVGGQNGSTTWYWPIIADFNGDGRSDIILDYRDGNRLPGGYRTLLTSNGDGTFTPTYNVAGMNGATYMWYHAVVGDYNGDGKADLLMDYRDGNGNPGGYRYLWLSNGDTTFQIVTSIGVPNGSHVWYWPVVGDFNGDGKADLLLDYRDGAGRPSGYRILYFSKGDGTFELSTTNVAGQNGTYVWAWPIIADFNGDGKSDILLEYRDGNKNPADYRWLWLSKGDGTFDYTTNSNVAGLNAAGYPWFWVELGDFDGDGKVDILMDYKDGNGVSGGYRRLWRRTTDSRHTLASVTPGVGVTTTVTYKPLTDSSVYTKDSGSNAARYPNIDLQMPLRVVSGVTSGDGIGGTVSASYTYGGFKANFDGRGALGFRFVESTDPAGIKARVEYEQAQIPATSSPTETQARDEMTAKWAYVGVPKLSTRTKASAGCTLSGISNTLKVSESTLAKLDFGSGAGTGTNTARVFAFASVNVDKSCDLNGAALPEIQTDTEYNDTYSSVNYGNVSKVRVKTTFGSDIHCKVTLNTYATPDTTNWILGRLSRAEVTSTTPPTACP